MMGLFSKEKNKPKEHLHTSEEHKYEALTPNNHIQNGQEYIVALDWALSQENVHNIAISGPYGSGKSSVIESYLKGRNRNDVVRISLAAFNLEEMDIESDKSIKNDKLETGILKQLFYSVETESIPQSRYRKLQPIKKGSNELAATVAMLIICTLIFFAFPTKWNQFVTSVFSKHIVFALLVSASLAYVVWYALRNFISWFRWNGSVQEIQVLDKATVKNAKEDKESIFNKNMDEIVYFFEMTGKTLVVIEDLDRFKSTNIFVALRELNSILNNYEVLKGKIRFVYAIRDDMFEADEERTKFFDFIIPIVPYISSTNSCEILRDKLVFDDDKDRSKICDITGEFVSLISPYISDARELICICNEFQIFKNTLKGNQNLDLDDKKMFALIVFKNRFPKDFAELEDEAETSIVRKAFLNKATFVENRRDVLNRKKEEVKKSIESIETDALHSIRELKIVLLSSLVNHSASVTQLDFDNKQIPISELLKDDFDINDLKDKRIVVHYMNGLNPNHKTIKDIEVIIHQSGEDYFGRIDILRKGIDKCKDDARKEIEEYEHRMNGLRTYSMKQLIEEFGLVFLDEPVRNNDLLVFLLRNGFFDDTYVNYINYFHPNTITEEEMNFILGIRNRRFEGGYTYPLKNVSKVFSYLLDYEFGQREVLNFDLVDYVLSYKFESSACNHLIEQLSDHSVESMSFIKAYVERGEHEAILLRALCRANRHLWADIESDDGIPLDTSYRYLVLLLRYADMNDIISLDVHDSNNESTYGILGSFIINNPSVLKGISDAPEEKQIDLITGLNIVFCDVQIDSISERIKKEIFDNNRYIINPQMIRRFFEWKAPELISDSEKKNYTVLSSISYGPLIDYVHANIVDYVENVVLEMETNTEEELEAVNELIEMLVSEHEDIAIKVLEKEKITWQDISFCCSGIEDETNESKQKIWDYLLTEDRIVCSWENLVAYYDKYGSSVEWAKYIDFHIDMLLNDLNNECLTPEIKESILLADISKNTFRKYISTVAIPPYSGKLVLLGEMKIQLMIEENALPFSVDFWNELKTVFPDCRVPYAEANKDEFMEHLEEIEVTILEYNSLLQSRVFEPNELYCIMKIIPAGSITKDTAKVLRSFKFRIDKKYSDAAWRLLDKEDKCQLLLNQLSNYDNEELPGMFVELDDEYMQLTERTKHKFRFANTDFNKQLLAALAEKDYISSVNEDGEKKHMLVGFVKSE